MRLNPNIPIGLCQCGCGGHPSLARVNYAKLGYVRGRPVYFCPGHSTRRSDPDHLWDQVERVEGCHPFTGSCDRNGYGKISHGGKFYPAHRLAYELTYGPVPQGLNVLHRCDNPPCCNPEHLFLGTTADNNRDRKEKGRNGNLYGTAHPNAKLSEDQAREIIRLYAAGDVSQMCLGQQFGVSQMTISHIIRGLVWKHVR